MSDIKDYLQDITKSVLSLGSVDLVKITGTADETTVEAIANDRSVIIQAKMNKVVPEFIGTFGMPNLAKLNTILNIPEYKDNAVITLSKREIDGVSIPDGLNFKNKTGDFKNDYRFMSQSIVNEKLKSVKFKGVKWNVEFHPTTANIMRMKFQASANSEETTFLAKTEDGDLKFFFGDASSHAGNFVFQSGITGNLSKAWAWPVGAVMSILNLVGEKTFYISDEGAAQITVNTGLTTYNFILPAQSGK